MTDPHAAGAVTTEESLPIRDRYTAFIARHDVAWELAMAAIVVAWVVIGFVGEGYDAAPFVEAVLTIILAAEFFTRFAASRDRRAYFRGHWIDAVALIPIPAIRGLRLIRLLRLLRLIRAFSGVYRALVSVERFATDRQLIWLFTSWLAVAFICSTALFLAEEGVNPAINEPMDALWWGVVTLTTVGYGDVFPVTTEGRLAAGALMILGITLFAAITATITSRLMTRGSARHRSTRPSCCAARGTPRRRHPDRRGVPVEEGRGPRAALTTEDHEAELDEMVAMLESAGLLIQTTEDGKPALQLTPNGAQVARQLAMSREAGQDALLEALLDASQLPPPRSMSRSV